MLGSGGNNFDVSGALPQVVVASSAEFLIQSPAGCDPLSTNCKGYGLYVFYNGIGIDGLTNTGPDSYGETQMSGTWVTTLETTPLPSTWTMLIAGFAGLVFFAYRGSKKGAAITAA